MTTGAWFHCFAGVAGDMTLASLVDAGADPDDIRQALDGLALPGWHLDVERTQRNGVRATHVSVSSNEDDRVHRTWVTIRAMLESASLEERPKRRALAVFERLAAAEASVHGTTPEQVHFHEVGAVDSIIDIAGSCVALELLGVDSVYVSPIAHGSGTIRAAHGGMPNPPPAVVELLKGVPAYGLDVRRELTTPTGAALMTTLAEGFGPMPRFERVECSGFGAGTAELDALPNCVQVVIGELESTRVAHHDRAGQPVQLLETNIDDATGETLSYAVARLMEGGAHDAWLTPIVMKKGRPAYTLSVLCEPAHAQRIAGILIDETGSFGLRGSLLDRWPVSRSAGAAVVDGEEIDLKIGPHRTKAEYEPAASVARASGRPLREVTRDAETQSDDHREGR